MAFDNAQQEACTAWGHTRQHPAAGTGSRHTCCRDILASLSVSSPCPSPAGQWSTPSARGFGLTEAGSQCPLLHTGILQPAQYIDVMDLGCHDGALEL